MAEFIREREYISTIIRLISFEIEKGWGYSFDCDENGVPLKATDVERIARFKETGQDEQGRSLTYKGIVSWEQGFWEPAIIRCRCGEEVMLEGDSECEECGQWYNSSGQALRNPSEWGEETGERFDDSGHYLGGGDDDLGI